MTNAVGGVTKADIRRMSCPECEAGPGEPCRVGYEVRPTYHFARMQAAQKKASRIRRRAKRRAA
jgi:hypothetical protein